MDLLVDIGHPAHVHYFKNMIGAMEDRGHRVSVSARDKEMTHYLLEELGIDFVGRGRGSDSLLGKAAYLLSTDLKLAARARRIEPDLFVSFGSPYAAHASSILGRPHLVFDDTENAGIGRGLYRWFSEAILTPRAYERDLGDKHFRFPGYMELCYLHPSHFSPDPDLVESFGIDPDEPYVLLRFVEGGANHDIRRRGVGAQEIVRTVARLEERAAVYISAEGALPEELEDRRLQAPPEHIHHVIAHASLVYGESATMASEAAVLGTPAIFLDDAGRGYTREQEEVYGLVSTFGEESSEQTHALEKALEILDAPADEYQSRRRKLLEASIDVTRFMVWLLDGYPASLERMRRDDFSFDPFRRSP